MQVLTLFVATLIVAIFTWLALRVGGRNKQYPSAWKSNGLTRFKLRSDRKRKDVQYDSV